MTESFDAKDDSELLVLMKERLRTAHIRDQDMLAVQNKILEQLHQMDTRSQITDHRLNALHTEHVETKGRLDALESDKKNLWVHLASVLSQIGLWGAK
jgi:hypothetical protein